MRKIKMKKRKLIVSLIISTLLFGVSLAGNVSTENLSSRYTQCKSNESLDVYYYLSGQTYYNEYNTRDNFGNSNKDSVISDQSSKVQLWKNNGVLSSCDDWNRISLVVKKSSTNEVLALLSSGACKINKPNYIKTGYKATGVDAQIHFIIGYYETKSNGSPSLKTNWVFRKFGENYRTCYPNTSRTGSHISDCPESTVHWNSTLKQHTGECINYRVFRCGDGIKNSMTGTTYNNGTFVEQCDYNDPNREGWETGTNKTCNQSCELVQNQQQQPACSGTYHNHTRYTTGDGTPILNAGMSLCVNGTVQGFTSTWSTGGSRHFTWECSNGTQIATGCLAYQRWCGDGKISNGESCDDAGLNGTPNHCNLACTGIIPVAPVCHSQYNGQTTYTTNGNPILNDSSSYLCEEGTPNNFSVSWTFGDPNGRHFTWKCSQSGYSSAYCSAYQKWCGDGVINSGSEDCEQYSSGHWGGCNTNCKLKDPSCTLTADPTQGSIPFTTNISGSTNDWWARVVYLNFGDGQSTGNGWDSVLPQSHTYSTVNTFYLTGTVINTHTPVRTGVTRPVNYCSVSVSTTTPPTPPTPLTGLSIEKEQISTGTMEAGSLVVYRIIARNTGSIAITGVTIYDALPKELQYVSSSISIVPTSSYHFTHGTVNIGGYTRAYILYTGITLEANGTATVYLTGMVKNGQTFNALTNCATVSGTNAQPQEDCVTVTPPTPPTPGTGSLSITKEQISTGTMEAGATVAYRIIARNTGTIAVTGVTIYDALPKELQYISSSISIVPTSSYHFTHGTVNIGGYTRAYILYTGITLGANGTATIYLTGKVKNGQTFNALTNCATVSGTNVQPQEDCVTVTPPTPGTPVPSFLKQQKVGNKPYTTQDIVVNVGDVIRYKLNFGNSGSVIATGEILDYLPQCLQYLTSSIVGVNTYDSSFPTLMFPTRPVRYYNFVLQPGQTGYVVIQAKVQGDGNCSNVTTYVNTGYFNLGGVTLSGDVVAKRPRPYVKKWQRLDDNDPWVDTLLHVNLGQFIQYKVDFGNSGSVGATGEVRDLLPNCVQYVSSTLHLVNGSGPTTGNEGGNTYVQFSNIYLTPGQHGYMLVLGKIKQEDGCQSVTGYLNTGMFHFVGQSRLTSEVLADRPNTTNVEITKTVTPTGQVQSGTVLTYTINYRNTGPDTLQSYTIIDYWPNDKLEYLGILSMNPQAQNYPGIREGNNIKWIFNNPLAPNGTGQIVIQGKVRE